MKWDKAENSTKKMSRFRDILKIISKEDFGYRSLCRLISVSFVQKCFCDSTEMRMTFYHSICSSEISIKNENRFVPFFSDIILIFTVVYHAIIGKITK